MKKTLAITAVGLFLITASACDLFNSLTKTTQGVSLLTQSPRLDQATGMDPALVTALGGVFDQIGATTAILVGIGERPDPTAIQAPTPVREADVLLRFSGTQVTVCENAGGQGTYSATSIAGDTCGDTNFLYEIGTVYTTEIRFDDVEASLQVAAPSSVNPNNVSFTPALAAASDHYGANLQSHTKNTALVIDWSADTAASQRPAIVSVFHIEFTGSAASDALDASKWQTANNPVHTSAPDTAAELIDIILLDKTPTEAEIPASVFNSRGLYFVMLTSTELSDATVNLSLGSGAMAGRGTAFVFWVE